MVGAHDCTLARTNQALVRYCRHLVDLIADEQAAQDVNATDECAALVSMTSCDVISNGQWKPVRTEQAAL